MLRYLLLIGALVCATTSASDQTFNEWLAATARDFHARGISAKTLRLAFNGLTPNPRVLELDRKQPEFSQTFWGYASTRVSDRRIEQGRDKLREHADLLREVTRRYGVPGRYLVAFWGLETNYGAIKGNLEVIRSLATLAHDGRRSDFFRRELFLALKMIDEGHGQVDMKGSWAGALGHTQFMPSTFNAYAVDGDGDGRIDLFNSVADAMHSAANYLSSAGWKPGELWGREVKVPRDFDWNLEGLGQDKSISEWSTLGVRQANGAKLPYADMEGAIIAPAGAEGPTFLVYRNFDVIMDWNRSVNYALTVGMLSDQLVGRPIPDLAPDGVATRFSGGDIKRLQARLNARGYDAGRPDGIMGSKTRQAIRAFQNDQGLTPDAYPTREVFERLGIEAS